MTTTNDDDNDNDNDNDYVIGLVVTDVQLERRCGSSIDVSNVVKRRTRRSSIHWADPSLSRWESLSLRCSRRTAPSTAQPKTTFYSDDDQLQSCTGNQPRDSPVHMGPQATRRASFSMGHHVSHSGVSQPGEIVLKSLATLSHQTLDTCGRLAQLS
jgi:hypothetical protein